MALAFSDARRYYDMMLRERWLGQYTIRNFAEDISGLFSPGNYEIQIAWPTTKPKIRLLNQASPVSDGDDFSANVNTGEEAFARLDGTATTESKPDRPAQDTHRIKLEEVPFSWLEWNQRELFAQPGNHPQVLLANADQEMDRWWAEKILREYRALANETDVVEVVPAADMSIAGDDFGKSAFENTNAKKFYEKIVDMCITANIKAKQLNTTLGSDRGEMPMAGRYILCHWEIEAAIQRFILSREGYYGTLIADALTGTTIPEIAGWRFLGLRGMIGESVTGLVEATTGARAKSYQMWFINRAALPVVYAMVDEETLYWRPQGTTRTFQTARSMWGVVDNKDQLSKEQMMKQYVTIT